MKTFSIILLCLTLFFCCQKKINYTKINSFDVDKEKRTIVFTAMFNPECTQPYFLFYFHGYPWIKNFSLFISTYNLQDFQTAVALIDWQLWNKIYTEKFSPEIKIKYLSDAKENWEEISNIVKLEKFDTKQTVFWGSSAYDSIVLSQNYQTSKCHSCNLLPLEQGMFLFGLNHIKYKFVKPIKYNHYYTFQLCFL